jgi:hypothetical protein
VSLRLPFRRVEYAAAAAGLGAALNRFATSLGVIAHQFERGFVTTRWGFVQSVCGWDEVETLRYRGRARSVPDLGTYRFSFVDHYLLELRDGQKIGLSLPGGPPTLLGVHGYPHALSDAISAGVARAQLPRLRAAVEAGEAVDFATTLPAPATAVTPDSTPFGTIGQLSVNGQGMRVNGDLISWDRIEGFRFDYFSDRLVYNQYAETVHQRLVFWLLVRPPEVPDGPESSRLIVPVEQVHNLFTLVQARSVLG